jgi:hypothetical protein
MKPAPNKYYHFGPFLPDGSGERQLERSDHHLVASEAGHG